MNSRVHLVISGRVQGVFYRATTQESGHRLGLRGWVRNMPNGDVEVVAEGERDKLEALIEDCRQGPPFARVENIEIEWSEPTGEFKDFRVRH